MAFTSTFVEFKKDAQNIFFPYDFTQYHILYFVVKVVHEII